MEKKKILNQVVQNDDYCWKDLTCTCRPWMTGFKSFGQTYEAAFLFLLLTQTLHTNKVC